jgi:uncharacterized hydrophobic protein (TIGR00271 family)
MATSPLYLVSGDTADPQRIAEALESIQRLFGVSARRVALGETDAFEEGATLFFLVSDAEYRRHILDYGRHPLRLLFLPTADNPQLQKDLLIPSRLEAAIALATEAAATTPQQSLTLCNGQVLQGEAILGEAEWLRHFPLFTWILYFLRHLRSLRLWPLRVETAKGRVVETAALIVPMAHERVRSRLRPYFFGEEENQCNRSAAVVYAPLSLFAIFRLRFYLFRPGRQRIPLPLGVGTLKSRRLSFRSADGPLPLTLNGRREYVAEVVLETVPLSARILLPEAPCVPGDPERESIRIQQLPTERELIEFYTKRRLPLVPIAHESLFADLFTTLREGARLGFSYLLLLIVSVLMASTGLFQDSAPTIIGAMILAPLMAPIISFAMGLIRFDGPLIRSSLRTLFLSVLLALGTAALLAMALPFTHLTQQMAMRTHPNLLDLAVAILSGIAAAYGYTDSKVGQSLAGVAIAVALVPPLSVAGIGLGWGDYGVFEGAFLLFLANFAGIITAAGAVFYLLGFSSWRTASSAFALKLLLLLTIAVPLWLSTQTLLREERLQRAFDTLQHLRVADRNLSLTLRRLYLSEHRLYAEVLILLPPDFPPAQRPKIIEAIRKKVGKEVKLIVAYRYLY